MFYESLTCLSCSTTMEGAWAPLEIFRSAGGSGDPQSPATDMGVSENRGPPNIAP